MTIPLILAGLGWLVASLNINFDTDVPGHLPRGWKSTMTHTGSAPQWEVLREATAPSKPNVVAQLSQDATSSRCPLLILDKQLFTDGEVSVKFKPISGKADQAAGLVWRCRDENNYYLVRGNARENNIVLYKVEDGKRISLAPKGAEPKTYGVKHKVPSQAWSILKVVFRGPRFEVYFGRKKLFEVEDRTFRGAGTVGLWTKADSVTYFDDFRVAGKR